MSAVYQAKLVVGATNEMADSGPTEAAELVLQERKRQRDEAKRREAKEAKAEKDIKIDKVQLEQVSTPKWEGAEAGEIDESELERRQRALSEKLERRQAEIARQSERLTRVREELRALEAPIKTEIMQIRQHLEEENRKEISLVASVNTLRTDLAAKEKDLKAVRATKQDLADKLIEVMADFERRKTERLNEIAELVGEERQPESKKKAGKSPKSSFSGF